MRITSEEDRLYPIAKRMAKRAPLSLSFAVDEPVETQLFVIVLCGPKRQREEPERVVAGQTGVEMSVE